MLEFSTIEFIVGIIIKINYIFKVFASMTEKYVCLVFVISFFWCIDIARNVPFVVNFDEYIF